LTREDHSLKSASQIVGIALVFGAMAMFALAVAPGGQSSRFAGAPGAARNSWNGITPLKSSSEDVARVLGRDAGSGEADSAGPYPVEGGEVTFSYLTASLAKIYRAPGSMVGKVFTVYFKPASALSRDQVNLGAGFKRCVDEMDRRYYYFVSEEGLAYQVLKRSDQIEVVIYQPSKAEIRRLAVNTACVF
jgi:hypothetical protein